MTTKSLLNTISKARKLDKKMREDLLATQLRMQSERLTRKLESAKLFRRKAVEHARELRVRSEKAAQTILILCALGKSKEFQNLLRERGRNLVLFSEESALRGMEWFSCMVMTSSHLVIRNSLHIGGKPEFEPIRLQYAYDSPLDLLGVIRSLRTIATSGAPGWIAWELMRMYDDIEVDQDEADVEMRFHPCFTLTPREEQDSYDSEFLFQILYECANEEVLKQLLDTVL